MARTDGKRALIPRKFAWLNIIKFACMIAASVQRADPCEPPFRGFDVRLRAWNVSQADGETAGRNVVSPPSLGCVLYESWRSICADEGAIQTLTRAPGSSHGHWRIVCKARLKYQTWGI